MNKKIFTLRIELIILVVIILMLFNVGLFNAIIPSGGTISPLSNSTSPVDSPQSVSAVAGNVTELNIYGTSVTQSWQGYYGNVTGTIELTDGSNNTLYNWSATSPRGEVYSSNESGVIWTNIMCFNFTANGTLCNEGIENRGGTSKCGMNLTQLESAYNINASDVDGVNETFNRQDHETFYSNSLLFGTGECVNTKLFDSEGVGLFDEVLLWSPESNATIFTSILKEDGGGFSGNSHDFEMIVLEDGHGTDIDITNYYFYVELQ
ncbi:hypothetical protein GOV12_06580 [Candidatus Pacearchaeota archaeon]|nr:hypothetical protein [Candidatus Pacearchaeota archaeon]